MISNRIEKYKKKHPSGDDLIVLKKTLVSVSKIAKKAHVYLEIVSDLRWP